MSLVKNVKSITECAPRTLITWDKAARIRRHEEIWANPVSIVHRLPEHFKRRFWENILRDAAPVHYRPPTARYSWDEKRLEMVEHEHNPIRALRTSETDLGLWGGEGVVKGWRESKPYTKKKVLPRHWIPRLWFPELRYAILYSEILDAHMKIQVTERALRLIDQHYGLDYYILETPEIDLDSKLANKLKREMLLTLAREDYYPEAEEKKDYIRRKYQRFRIPEDEAEWIGLTLNEASRKQQDLEESIRPEPVKYKLARQLIERLEKGDDTITNEEDYRPMVQESKFGERLLGRFINPITDKLRK